MPEGVLFEVKRLCDKRIKHGELQYQVEWVGWPNKTWSEERGAQTQLHGHWHCTAARLDCSHSQLTGTDRLLHTAALFREPLGNLGACQVLVDRFEETLAESERKKKEEAAAAPPAAAAVGRTPRAKHKREEKVAEPEVAEVMPRSKRARKAVEKFEPIGQKRMPRPASLAAWSSCFIGTITHLVAHPMLLRLLISCVQIMIQSARCVRRSSWSS